MNNQDNFPDKRILDLPYAEFKGCCEILDKNNDWEELAGQYMGYGITDIQDIKLYSSKKRSSPADRLLNLWDYHNHTVSELFFLLCKMNNYEGMLILKEFVNPKYHKLIRRPPRNLTLNDVKINNEDHNTDENVRLNVNRNQNGVDDNVRLEVDRNQNGVEHISKIEVNVKVNVPPLVYSRENNESSAKNMPRPKVGSELFAMPLVQGNSAISDISHDVISAVASAAGIPQIPYEDLRVSTNNWDEKTILGRGGFGIVFKGTWKCTQVAIKRIEEKKDNPESYNIQIRQSITELHCLNTHRHDNVLPLYGYSMGGPQPCLVYQYMPGGCLERRLRIRNPAGVLNWLTRLNIAIGTARGLQFLHTIRDKPLIHGDIKSANILLDPNDTPRIGDFGLAREGPSSEYIRVSSVHGTQPYLPREFLVGRKFSIKVDTYSFGVVLFEIATSLAVYSKSRADTVLKDHVVNYEGDILELKDPRPIGGDSCFRGLMDIGMLCVSKLSSRRPEMVQVLKMLEEVLH